MMKKIYFILIVLVISGCFSSRNSKKTTETPPKKTNYFVPVPIVKFNTSQCPCIEVKIEDTTWVMKLDLGFRGDVTIDQNVIDQIVDKQFLAASTTCGIRGKEYPTNLYQIPDVKIGNATFMEPIVQEESRELVKESAFVKDGGEPSPSEIGKIGWQLFQVTNLFIDAKNDKIGFCDSLDTLKQNGYDTTDFIQAPLLTERGLVEFEAVTTEGILRYALDTGCTYNVIHGESAENKPLEIAFWDPANEVQYHSFHIAENDFGAISFRRFPIKLPIHVDAIVGMEFLREQIVFFDFVQGSIYFAKHKAPETAEGIV